MFTRSAGPSSSRGRMYWKAWWGAPPAHRCSLAFRLTAPPPPRACPQLALPTAPPPVHMPAPMACDGAPPPPTPVSPSSALAAGDALGGQHHLLRHVLSPEQCSDALHHFGTTDSKAAARSVNRMSQRELRDMFAKVGAGCDRWGLSGGRADLCRMPRSAARRDGRFEGVQRAGACCAACSAPAAARWRCRQCSF